MNLAAAQYSLCLSCLRKRTLEATLRKALLEVNFKGKRAANSIRSKTAVTPSHVHPALLTLHIMSMATLKRAVKVLMLSSVRPALPTQLHLTILKEEVILATAMTSQQTKWTKRNLML